MTTYVFGEGRVKMTTGTRGNKLLFAVEQAPPGPQTEWVNCDPSDKLGDDATVLLFSSTEQIRRLANALLYWADDEDKGE